MISIVKSIVKTNQFYASVTFSIHISPFLNCIENARNISINTLVTNCLTDFLIVLYMIAKANYYILMFVNNNVK